MKKRTFYNRALNDTVTILETSEDTNGKRTVMEFEIFKSSGPPMHYHGKLTEKFEVVEGRLYLIVGNQKHILEPGNQVIIPPKTPHKFYNPVTDKVRFRTTFEPGDVGMENFIKIMFSLADDNLTNSKGVPKKFSHLAALMSMSDQYAAGILGLLAPLIRRAADKAQKDGTERWLIDRYCG